MKEESLSWVVYEALKEYCYDGTDEGEELLASVSGYLYRTSTDEKMKEDSIKMLTTLNYCAECGSKMQSYHYKEYHEEVDADEVMTAFMCPICDRDEIMEMK